MIRVALFNVILVFTIIIMLIAAALELGITMGWESFWVQVSDKEGAGNRIYEVISSRGGTHPLDDVAVL